MRIRIAGAALVALAVLAAPVPAAGHVEGHPTEVALFHGATAEETDLRLFGGVVKSSRKACYANRPLRLLALEQEGGRRVVDQGRSSQNGAYSLGAVLGTGDEAVRARASRRQLGRKSSRHDHYCEPAISAAFPTFLGGAN